MSDNPKVPATAFATLYCTTKRGQIQTWNVYAIADRVITRFGLQGGKVQESTKRCNATNVGRANERNATEQAVFEADALWKKQIRLGYRKSVDEAKEVTFGPMLAQKFDGREKKIQYPVHVQPKLDGIRCLAYKSAGVVILMSRGNKPFVLPHLCDALQPIFDAYPDIVLDGELYTPGISMQTIASWVKRAGHPEQHKIQYHVYDVPSDDPWRTRFSMLKMVVPLDGKIVRRVLTNIADSPEHVWKLQRHYVGNGYEGAIVRVMDCPYEFGNRSYGLLKVKKFCDAEYKIVGVEEGRGKMEGAAIFKCVTPQGKEFDCVMRGTMEQRKAMFKDRKKLIGKNMTVRFFDVTDDMIPRFPVGICVRDYE